MNWCFSLYLEFGGWTKQKLHFTCWNKLLVFLCHFFPQFLAQLLTVYFRNYILIYHKNVKYTQSICTHMYKNWIWTCMLHYILPQASRQGKHKKLFTVHKVGSCPIDDNAKVICGQTLSVLNSNHIIRNHSQMFQWICNSCHPCTWKNEIHSALNRVCVWGVFLEQCHLYV